MRSGLKVEGVNWDWATVYIAACMTLEEVIREGLQDVIPARRYKCGSRPTIRTIDMKDAKSKWKW